MRLTTGMMTIKQTDIRGVATAKGCQAMAAVAVAAPAAGGPVVAGQPAAVRAYLLCLLSLA